MEAPRRFLLGNGEIYLKNLKIKILIIIFRHSRGRKLWKLFKFLLGTPSDPGRRWYLLCVFTYLLNSVIYDFFIEYENANLAYHLISTSLFLFQSFSETIFATKDVG